MLSVIKAPKTLLRLYIQVNIFRRPRETGPRPTCPARGLVLCRPALPKVPFSTVDSIESNTALMLV
eukprot:5000925-Pyramimonas_sp.AAC.1